LKNAFVLFLLVFCLGLGAQEEPDWESQFNDTLDSDSFFNDDSFNDPSIEVIEDTPPINLRDKITLEAAYGFTAAFVPGWNETPWSGREKEYSYRLGAKMEALLSIDLPLTEALRVHNAFYFIVPDKDVFSIKEFYFEYDFFDKVYLQAGLYEIAWGISRFYPFTNLPALVQPDNNTPGDSYIARLKIPIGIGGLEILGMTRYGYMEDKSSPTVDELAFGMKYNMAFQAADIDTGVLYYKPLPVRYFISIKTTLGNTELYTEGLVSVTKEKWPETHFSGNLGFVQDLFKGKLTLSGEVFYNGEPNAAWWRQKTDILDENVVDLYKGLNGALAFVFRPGVIGMRIFAQALYTYEQESVWLVPGISVKPGGINITLSVPMALGSRRDPNDQSNYYRNNTDKDGRKDGRPFSIILGISFNGKLRYTI